MIVPLHLSEPLNQYIFDETRHSNFNYINKIP